MNIKALLNTLSSHSHTLPIVILYVTEGCNLQCITCSYREPTPNELSLKEITELAKRLKEYGLRHIVFSGGEPLLRRDLPQICNIFGDLGVKQTLLTNGLLLEKRLPEVQKYLSEIIVSIDGPDEKTHNAIRGVKSFEQIVKGVRRVVDSSDRQPVSIRTVLQKRNFSKVTEMVDFAKSLRVDRISFLSADVRSNSFGRDTRGTVAPDGSIVLTEAETNEFRSVVNRMVSEYGDEFEVGYISESPAKMYHIVQYYEAIIGKAPFPRNFCNAPMISAVITSTGEILPCFFLPSFGNVRHGSIENLINNSTIRSTRRDVRRYTLERCHTCVCTLHVQPHAALFDRF
jgi:MoaA/NifB/PqqE/SkfB family radical SAM enzyme